TRANRVGRFTSRVKPFKTKTIEGGRDDLMLSYVITASINELGNLKPLSSVDQEDLKVLIIDEGDARLRAKNDEHLGDIPHEYFGPKERREWFKIRFGSAYKRYAGVIPERCHAETSFGFLVAYEENADLVLELDDDVHISRDLVEKHAKGLSGEEGITVHAEGKWYNTIENLVLNDNSTIYPRGHPYSCETRQRDYSWMETGGKCVLNMGLWLQQPDLDAPTLLYHSGLDGRCNIIGKACKRGKVIVGRGTYFAVCSMNTSFRTQVVPAFYQLYMNTQGIDRFDDIWSGIFLKRITDHLGEKICIGEPLGSHLKRSRSVFNDLRKELGGLIINEILWRIVDEAELSSKSFSDCYLELSEYLSENLNRQIKEPAYVKFMRLQTQKMRTWVKAIDRLS
ncbi:MAG: hypothetical protein JSW53_05600, partial [Candidatus Bathyarchaeota archaeon]